jgi:peptidoglycan/LPS O-acetylase OafA/YrhL
MDPARPRRSNCFDFLRLFAAVSVVVSHAIVTLNGVSFLWLSQNGHAWFYDGVPMFFILSGYLVFRSAEQNSLAGRATRVYLRNRVLRIVPAIAVYFAIVILAELVFYGVPNAAPWKWPQMLWGGIHFPNGSLWTLPAEFSFYLIVPLLLIYERRRGSRRLIFSLLAVSVAGAAIVLADENGLSDGFTYLMRYTFLPWLAFFGIGIAWLRFEHRIPLTRLGFAIATLAYITLRTLDVFGVQDRFGAVAIEFVGAIPLSYAIFFVGYKGPAFLASVTRRIGDLSYATYIWHMFVVDVLIQTGAAAAWPKAVLPAAVLGFTLAIAFVSWWVIEGPALRLKRYSSRTVPLPLDVTAAPSAQED